MPSVPSAMDPAPPPTSSLRLGMRFGAHSGRRLPAILLLCSLANLLHVPWAGLRDSYSYSYFIPQPLGSFDCSSTRYKLYASNKHMAEAHVRHGLFAFALSENSPHPSGQSPVPP